MAAAAGELVPGMAVFGSFWKLLEKKGVGKGAKECTAGVAPIQLARV
jgi:hypothetical protein